MPRTLQPFQQRVVEERDQLQKKEGDLAIFLHTETYRSLPTDEQVRMAQQLGFMKAYREILDVRIGAF
jgi:hypothetical protein